MTAYIVDWLSLLLRWLHVITAIAWIGSSFYFVWLDLSLRKREGLAKGVHGESWSVHGGGFYHVQKYMVAPEQMPAELHWFKYESYFTWLSGFALLCVTYYAGARSFLIDPNVADLSVAAAIGISMGSLVVGWLVYDLLCKSPMGKNIPLLGALVFVYLLLATWGYEQVFSARATLLHVGAMIATMMSANVFLIIIPNQKKVVASLKAGEAPDPALGLQAKQRSTHNNYLTLPVLFMMLSNHYPMTFGAGGREDSLWIVAALVILIGAIVRAWYNADHAGKTGMQLLWQWPVATLLTVILAAFLYVPAPSLEAGEAVPTDQQAMAIVNQHCAVCHADQPTQPGFAEAPGGVELHTLERLRAHLEQVNAQSVAGRAMPLGNMTGMTEEERRQLGLWISTQR